MKTASDKSILSILGKPPVGQALGISILCFVMLFFAPGTAAGIVEDPYIFNRLVLRVDFIYNEYHYGTSDRTFDSSGFEQRYGLEVKGSLIDHRLIAYDADIEFTDTAFESAGFESTATVESYRLKTMILRQSRLPLTLFANRNISESSWLGETTTDNYGFDWNLKLRTLPWTRLAFEKTETQARGTAQEIDSYNINMAKNIGPTSNAIGYSLVDTKDTMNRSGSENSVITVNNDSRLPLDSAFHLGLVQYDLFTFDRQSKKETNTMAGSLELKTKPTKKFNQQYNYTFVQSDYSNGNSTDSEYFNGRIGYTPTDRLAVGLTSNINESKTKTPSTTKVIQREDWSAWANYRTPITSELSTQESIKYTRSKSTIPSQVTGKTERDILDASGTLDYAKRMHWALFSAGSSLGYHLENVDPGTGGEGVSYGLNTALREINLTYLTLGTTYDYSAVESFVDNVDQTQQTFGTNASSAYIKYLPVNASYTYGMLDSYIPVEDNEENTVTANVGMHYLEHLPVTASYSRYTLVRPHNPSPSDIQYVFVKQSDEDSFTVATVVNYLQYLPVTASYNHSIISRIVMQPSDKEFAVEHVRQSDEHTFSLTTNLTYFRNTDIAASTAYSEQTRSIVEVNSSIRDENVKRWDTGINGSHRRAFLGGGLTLSAGYKKSLYQRSVGADEDIINMYLRGQYGKRLSRNMAWTLTAERNYNEINNLYDVQDSAETTLSYRLRAWLLYAEYMHAVRRAEMIGDKDIIEDRFMLRASRSFVRFF